MKEKFDKKLSFYRTNVFSIEILGVRVDFLSIKKTISLIEKWVKSNKKYQITTPNPEQIVLAREDYRFKKILNESALAIPDGIGLVIAAWLLKRKKKTQKLKTNINSFKRLSGVDLMIDLCQLAAKNNWRIFLLGGRKGIAQSVKRTILNEGWSLMKDGPSTKIAIDCFSGAVDIKKETAAERKEAIVRINQFQPDLLFVAYGAPWQEKWIAGNLSQLKVKVAMGVGCSFDYLAREAKRSPKFLRKIGLEWLWRLLNQPWRIRRQISLAKFVYLFCFHS